MWTQICVSLVFQQEPHAARTSAVRLVPSHLSTFASNPWESGASTRKHSAEHCAPVRHRRMERFRPESNAMRRVRIPMRRNT